MTLESLEKLHCIYGSKCSDECYRCDIPNMIGEIADAIQAEVDEKYMELPVDADGVPWHIGDITENGNVVNGISFDSNGAHFVSTLNDIDPGIHTHYKQRTVEDVLNDFFQESRNFNLKRDGELKDAIGKYAFELRMRDAE